MGKFKWTVCLFDALRLVRGHLSNTEASPFWKRAAKFRPLLSINRLRAVKIHVDSNSGDNSGDAAKIAAVILSHCCQGKRDCSAFCNLIQCICLDKMDCSIGMLFKFSYICEYQFLQCFTLM